MSKPSGTNYPKDFLIKSLISPLKCQIRLWWVDIHRRSPAGHAKHGAEIDEEVNVIDKKKYAEVLAKSQLGNSSGASDGY